MMIKSLILSKEQSVSHKRMAHKGKALNGVLLKLSKQTLVMKFLLILSMVIKGALEDKFIRFGRLIQTVKIT